MFRRSRNKSAASSSTSSDHDAKSASLKSSTKSSTSSSVNSHSPTKPEQSPTTKRSSSKNGSLKNSSSSSLQSHGSSSNNNSKTRATSALTTEQQQSTTVPSAVQQEILNSMGDHNVSQLRPLLTRYPQSAVSTKYGGPHRETLLSLAILQRAPLPIIQAIYQAHPPALTTGNAHGMSPLHQAATVPTPLDVMLYLVTQLKQQQPKSQQSQSKQSQPSKQKSSAKQSIQSKQKQSSSSKPPKASSTITSVAQLVAPGGWSVLHTACRCGTLPTDTFQYLLQQARTTCAQPTADKGSTPLHLAIFGVSNSSNSSSSSSQSSGGKKHSSADQRLWLQTLLQAYPYAVSLENKAGFTPVQLAQHQASKGHLPTDIVALMVDVQTLCQRKYSTRYQVELAIGVCQATLDRMNHGTAATDNQSVSSGSGATTTNEADSHGNNHLSASSQQSGGSSSQNASDQKLAYRQAILAHMEMQMLLPLRKKFCSEAELRHSIEQKMQQRQQLQAQGPTHLAQTMALNEQIIQLEAKLRKELQAVVPQEIQATSTALLERLKARVHVLPINNVSLQWLQQCTDDFSDKIGKGGFGSVYRAYDGATCTQYAIKKTEKVNDPSLLREVEVLAHVFHPNVVNLLGFYVPPEGRAPEYLVFEFAAGGTLADRVSSEENRQSLPWNIRVSAAVGIASGLNYLHHGMDNKIYHHDVKPENIVFTETLDRAILIDCGISKVLKDGKVTSFKQTMAGTPFYLPDDYTEDTPYDEKCEVFSFGMVLRVMIAGKMPKSLSDRNSPLEADPLAGEWPEEIKTKFVDMTQQCVDKEAAARPTIDHLYKELMALEQEAEQQLPFTAEQEEAIHDTLTKSRAKSRESRTLEAFGKCFCSRTKKNGLYCPGKKHFQCTECFNKYVLDCLGEEIYCREACSCRDPYTLDELHHHLSRSVLCRHVESLMRNQELKALKKANSRLTNEIGKGFDRVMKGITVLARDELQCPILAILIPARSDCRSKSVMKRAMRSWKTSTSKTFFLYFLCAHDKRIVPAPIRVDASRDWVKAAAPFLRAVLCGLQIAVMAAGIPLSIPMMDRDKKQDSITENLVVLDSMLVEVSGNDRMVNRDMQQVFQAMQNGGGGTGQRLSSESYRLVAELANQPGNTAWRDRMVLAEKRGELAWVSRENEARWKHG